MRSGAPTSRNRLRLRIAPFDFVWLTASPFIALMLRDPAVLAWDAFPDGLPAAYQYALVTIVCALPAFLVFRLSQGMTPFFSVHDVLAVSAAVATTTASSSLILFVFTRLDGVPRSTPLIYALVLGTGLIADRTFSRYFGAERAADAASGVFSNELRKVILIGADRFSALVIKLIESQSPRTTQVVAVLDDNRENVGRSINGVQVAGRVGDLGAIIDEYVVHGVAIDSVWIAEQSSALSDLAIYELEAVCDSYEIECARVSDLFGLTVKSAALTETPRRLPQAAALSVLPYFRTKRLIDIGLSLILISALLPLWVFVSAVVLFDVGTPMLFWQERLGRGGRRFLVHKFRTYRAPFDWRGNPVPHEERLSVLGRFLRATRFDELPQLLNILVGDMSLIGPRPLLPRDQPADPTLRLSVRPGITGWAQANGGNLVTPEEKDALDVYYVRHATFRLDLKIIWLTIKVLFGGERRDVTALAVAEAGRANFFDEAAE